MDARNSKKPRKADKSLSGGMQYVALRGVGQATSHSSGMCTGRVTRRVRNPPWRGER